MIILFLLKQKTRRKFLESEVNALSKQSGELFVAKVRSNLRLRPGGCGIAAREGELFVEKRFLPHKIYFFKILYKIV